MSQVLSADMLQGDMEIPLFPLSSVLVPFGRIPLQIFEQRYLDLVRSCMKSDSGFGVVWIKQGYEVAGTSSSTLVLGDYGTYARIVDWDQLANGLLGVTIEGRQTFTLGETRSSDTKQMYGQARFENDLSSVSLQGKWQGLASVLRGLETHPHVQKMNLDIDYENAWQVGYHLIQLLPLEEAVKYQLLGAVSLDIMLGELDSVLGEFSG